MKGFNIRDLCGWAFYVTILKLVLSVLIKCPLYTIQWYIVHTQHAPRYLLKYDIKWVRRLSTLYTNTVFQTWPFWFWTIRSFQEAAFADLIGCCLALRRPGRCRRFCKLRSPTRKLRNWRKRSDHKICFSKSDTNRRGCHVSKTSFKVTGTQYLIIKSPSDIIVHSKTTSTRQLLFW